MQQLVYTPEELERIQMGVLALLCYAKRHDRRELPRCFLFCRTMVKNIDRCREGGHTPEYRAGIKTVIIPADNEPDLAEIDQVVKDGIEFHPVSKLDEVLRLALVEMPKPAPLAPQKDAMPLLSPEQAVPAADSVSQ